MTTRDEALDFLLHRGREIILERFEPTSCIISTRVAIEVLKVHGLKAVKVEALNPHAVRDVEAKAAEPRLGSWIVGVEGTGLHDYDQNSWDGHLVAMFEDSKGEVLLDISADQFARPAKDIHAEPLAIRLTGEWPVGRLWPNGSAIAYSPIRARSYRNSSNWRDRERWGPPFERIMGEMG
jgi:hypothetical protein